MEVIRSNKGGQKILLDGYMYTKKSTRKACIWWSCVCSRTLQCKGSLKTSLTVEDPEIGATHNHDPSPATTEVAKDNMKQLAAVTREKPAHLVIRTLTDITEDARLRFPKEDAAKKTIRRVRSGQCQTV